MIVVLDAEAGKIRCLPDGMPLCVGDLLTYYVTKKRQLLTLCALDRIALPLTLAHTELLFFHHVLEICNYCILPGMSMPGVFSLLEALYKTPVQQVNVTFKKCFLAKLFVLLGMYPEGPLGRHASFYTLIALPLDSIPNEAMLDDIGDRLHVWLRSCVLEHPQMQNFNTIHFLTEYGVL